MQDSNQFNNIFRQIQNGHFKRSSSEEEGKAEEAPFSGTPEKWKESDIPPYPQSNDPDVWDGYVDYLYQLLFAYMLGSVDVFSAKEWDWACKNHIYEPNHTLAQKAQYVHNEEVRDCYIVGERKLMEERLRVTKFARTITHSIYIANNHIARLNEEEDSHFGREEGEPI